MFFRKGIFGETDKNKEVNNKLTDTGAESEKKKKYQQFYDKWVNDFTSIGNTDIKRLTKTDAKNLHNKLIEKNKEFLNDRNLIKSIEIPLEDKILIEFRDSNISRVNIWYENSFITKLNSLSSYLENIKIEPDTIETEISVVDVNKKSNKTDEEIQANKIYEKWIQHFKVLSTIIIDQLSEKEINVFHEELSKKSDEFNKDKIKYFSNAQNNYIQDLCNEIEKKFEQEHSPKIHISEVFLNLTRLLQKMVSIVPPNDTMKMLKLNSKKQEPIKFSLNLNIEEIRNKYLTNLENMNNQLISDLQFNTYIFNRKNKVERLKAIYESVKKTIDDIQEEPAIKNLIVSLNAIFNRFEEFPEYIKNMQNKIEDNKWLIVKCEAELDTFEKIQQSYLDAQHVLKKRQLVYEELIHNYRNDVEGLPKIEMKENMTWNEMVSCKEELTQSIQIETTYLENFENFYLFKTSFNHKKLACKINEMNNNPVVPLDTDSLDQIQEIDNTYGILNNTAYEQKQKSEEKCKNLKLWRSELKKQMLDFENDHLIKQNYAQVKYLKFKAIKQYILNNNYFNELKDYGRREGSNKSMEISVYISKVEAADTLAKLFDAIQCDLKIKNKAFRMRENLPMSCSNGWYSWFHQGKSTTDNYALSLESELINFTQSICRVSCRETPNVYAPR